VKLTTLLLSGSASSKETRRNSKVWPFFTMIAPTEPKSLGTWKSSLNVKFVSTGKSRAASQFRIFTSSLRKPSPVSAKKDSYIFLSNAAVVIFFHAGSKRADEDI